MSRREPFAVRVVLPVFLVFKLNEGGARVAFDHDALASISENGADALAKSVRWRGRFGHSEQTLQPPAAIRSRFMRLRLSVGTRPLANSAKSS